MVSKGRKAARELQRRRPRIDPRPRILVVCEGIVTEAEYFNDFRQSLRASISLIVDDKGGTPKTLVERAVAEKRQADVAARRSGDQSSRYSEIWCVFDIDAHPLVPEARQQAQAHGIKLAITNPCFELWLLLHFRDQTAYIDRHAAQHECKGHMPGYEKHPPIKLLLPRYEQAVKRAQDLAARAADDGEHERNPTSGIYLLTERLKSIGQAALLEQLRG